MNDRVADAVLHAPQSNDLMRLYRPGAGVFASPRGSVLTQGVHAAVPQGPQRTLAERARDLLADVVRDRFVRPMLIGAVPFRAEGPARLFVPDGAVLGQGVPMAVPQRVVASTRRVTRTRELPTPYDYRRHVAEALVHIEAGHLDKVVLSRSLEVSAQIDRPGLLRRLMARNPVGYTFAVDMNDGAGTTRTLMGASPELLLARRGRQVVSHPLAGSVPRSADDSEDRRRGAALLSSAKDLREHAIVVDAVAERLAPLCSQLSVPERPSLVATPTMWHLGTEVSGQLTGDLRSPQRSSLGLALALHPTPAVCGHPAQEARDFILDTEGFDRRFFAGLVGWCDAAGDGEWAVTIRCAEVDAQSATLYAGAGIVAGSDPELELRETTAKLGTMLAAMDLSPEFDLALEQTA